MKGKRIPSDFNIKDFDTNGRIAISESGNMTRELWETVTVRTLIN